MQGIIGPGDVCVHKSGPAFARATGSAIGAVSKRSPGAAAAFASRLPGGGEGVAAYTGSAGLLADPAVAAVYVATPPGAHANLTAAAAAAGMAVYVEKPMARCGAEAAAMLTAVGGGRLAVAYYRRALAKYAWVRALLRPPVDAGGAAAAAPPPLPAGVTVAPAGAAVPAAGCLGTLTSVAYTYVGHHAAGEVGWRDDPPVSGGGMMLDVGVHVVNLMQYWFGEDPAVEGTPVATPDPVSGVEAAVAFRLRFPPGGGDGGGGGSAPTGGAGADRVAVDFDFDFCAAPDARRVDEVVLTGTAGVARLSVLGVDGPVEVTVRGTAETAAGDKDACGGDGGGDAQPPQPTLVTFPVPPHVQQPLIQAVVDDWTGVPGAPPQPSPAAAAVRTSELVDEVLVGVYGERRMGFWEGWAKPGGARS